MSDGVADSNQSPGMAQLRAALVGLAAGEQPTEDLPSLAAEALSTGDVDSPSLRELAGLSSKDVREARDLFIDTMEELGINMPSEAEATRMMARTWAREMLAGSLSPYEGSRLIWARAWHRLGCPDEMTAFVVLATDWVEDPEHRLECEHEMLVAAQRLVDVE